MSIKRTNYSAAEKAKIALEAIKGELTSDQISAKYSVHATQVNTWKRQALAYLPNAFSEKIKQEVTAYEVQLANDEYFLSGNVLTDHAYMHDGRQTI